MRPITVVFEDDVSVEYIGNGNYDLSGFYKLEKETPKKINDAYKELSKELN